MGVIRRESDGRTEVLAYDNLLGRSRVCNIRLTSPEVSANHASIKWSDEQWKIRDLQSANGTQVGQQTLDPSGFITLGQDMIFSVGSAAERWRLVDDCGPRVSMKKLEDDSLLFEVNSMILLGDDPAYCPVIRRGESGWVMERGDTVTPVVDGGVVETPTGRYQASIPLGPLGTTHVHAGGQVRFHDLELHLKVMPDHEKVHVVLKHPHASWDLGLRSCYYLLYALADISQRASDEDDASWVNTQSLLDRLGPSSSMNHLNVDVYRIRKYFQNSGVPDGQRIIDRRPQQLRLGLGGARVKIITES